MAQNSGNGLQIMTDRLTQSEFVGRVGMVQVRPVSRPTGNRQTKSFLRRGGLDTGFAHSTTELGCYD